MRVVRFILSTFVSLALGGAAFAQSAHGLPHWRSTRLPNGLRVLISQDKSVQTVTVHVTYLAGAAEDPPGECGTAHLLEHMMFRGSENVASGEFGLWIRRTGGEFQGSTGLYRTVFYETIPSTELKLALYLEADRMHSLVFDSNDLDAEKRVVQAEATGKGINELERLRDFAWSSLTDTPGSTCPVVGRPADISKLNAENIQGFYRQHYAPSNALLIITGNCSYRHGRRLAERFFGAIPAGPVRQVTESGPPNPQKLVFAEDKSGRRPKLYGFFGLGNPDTVEWYSKLILGQWLADGEDSLLYRSLVEGNRRASAVHFSVQPRRRGALATITIEMTDTVNSVVLRQQVTKAISSLSTMSLDEAALAKLKRRLWVEMSREDLSSIGRADGQSQTVALFGKLAPLERPFSLLARVSIADIKSAARSLFVKPATVLGPEVGPEVTLEKH